MYRVLTIFMILLAVGVFLPGCGPDGRVKEKTVEVQQKTPLEDAKNLLQNYANGQRMGSEATTFTYLVNEVKKTDPQKAEILEKGFEELQKPGTNTAAKAKEILGKL